LYDIVDNHAQQCGISDFTNPPPDPNPPYEFCITTAEEMRVALDLVPEEEGELLRFIDNMIRR